MSDRPPRSVVLRVDTDAETGNRLPRLSRSTRSVVTLRRCHVVLHSAQGFTPPRIAELLGLSPDYVRAIIKAFHAAGFEALRPKRGRAAAYCNTHRVRGLSKVRRPLWKRY